MCVSLLLILILILVLSVTDGQNFRSYGRKVFP